MQLTGQNFGQAVQSAIPFVACFYSKYASLIILVPLITCVTSQYPEAAAFNVALDKAYRQVRGNMLVGMFDLDTPGHMQIAQRLGVQQVIFCSSSFLCFFPCHVVYFFSSPNWVRLCQVPMLIAFMAGKVLDATPALQPTQLLAFLQRIADVRALVLLCCLFVLISFTLRYTCGTSVVWCVFLLFLMCSVLINLFFSLFCCDMSFISCSRLVAAPVDVIRSANSLLDSATSTKLEVRLFVRFLLGCVCFVCVCVARCVLINCCCL